MTYQERTYRNYVRADNLVKFEVIEKESDLLILCRENLYDKALAALLQARQELEQYAADHQEFTQALKPLPPGREAAPLIKTMCQAGKQVKVGPMAAVAGAIAEQVGRELLQYSDEVIVENGGDIFLKTNSPRKVGVYAGSSPFSEKLAIEVDPRPEPFAVCTSSGTVGHSLSFGKADAVLVIAGSAALADAAATALGNMVQEVRDIDATLKAAKKIRGLEGALVIKDDQLGVLGKIKLVPC